MAISRSVADGNDVFSIADSRLQLAAIEKIIRLLIHTACSLADNIHTDMIKSLTLSAALRPERKSVGSCT